MASTSPSASNQAPSDVGRDVPLPRNHLQRTPAWSIARSVSGGAHIQTPSRPQKIDRRAPAGSILIHYPSQRPSTRRAVAQRACQSFNTRRRHRRQPYPIQILSTRSSISADERPPSLPRAILTPRGCVRASVRRRADERTRTPQDRGPTGGRPRAGCHRPHPSSARWRGVRGSATHSSAARPRTTHSSASDAPQPVSKPPRSPPPCSGPRLSASCSSRDRPRKPPRARSRPPPCSSSTSPLRYGRLRTLGPPCRPADGKLRGC